MLRVSLQVRRPCMRRSFSLSAPSYKERLVILGSGWGGYEVLRRVDKKRWDVTVISPTNFFNFTPLLAGCAVGTLELRCAVEPVRRYSPQVTAYQAWCDKIDLKQKTLLCMPATAPVSETSSDQIPNSPFKLNYDKLVIAVGAYSQTFNIPGVKEHAHFLKDVKDARSIRARILECFEQASQPILSDVERKRLLNFCIVGGGPTGVEFAAELHDLLHTDMAKHYPSLTKFSKITLYDVAKRILSSFDVNLVKYAEKTFGREGISILTSHHVDRVEQGKLFVREQGEVPFGLLVWATGLAPNPLINSLSELKRQDRTNSLITDANLNVMDVDGTVRQDIWAIGDAATIEGKPLPATAQVANQKGKYLARQLNRIVREQDYSKPFVFKNLGTLAYVGDWKALYQPGSGDSGFMQKESGRIAWLLWRSAYFTMTLSWRNKILVPTYWFLNWIFGRDLTRF